MSLNTATAPVRNRQQETPEFYLRSVGVWTKNNCYTLINLNFLRKVIVT